MLVYLATYPRSGNSLLQRILVHNFWRLPSQMKASARHVPRIGKIAGWERRLAPAAIADWPEAAVWTPYTALYRRKAADEPWRRQLLDIPAEHLTLELRQALAGESTPFFLKTHNLPFAAFLDGEAVIQVVRSPGPALWSYFRLLVRQAIERGAPAWQAPPPTLDRIIAGDVQFGGWSDYHAAWAKAGAALGERLLTLRFEGMSEDQSSVRTALHRFLRLPVMAEAPVDFEAYRSRHPDHGLRGTDEGYERCFSTDQLERLWALHGARAEALGYGPPGMANAGDGEQVADLNRLVELAWSAASAHHAADAAVDGHAE